MNTKINVNQFKAHFADTLQQDSQGTYFKVYVKDYHQLQLFNHYITKAIGCTAQALEQNNTNEDIAYSISYLTKLLQATSLTAESEGLDRLLE